jgi:hypothetical protein
MRLYFGSCVLDIDTREMRRDRQRIHLTLFPSGAIGRCRGIGEALTNQRRPAFAPKSSTRSELPSMVRRA